MSTENCYEDGRLAGAYAKLEFPGTYYLAFRDLPAVFVRHVRGHAALDFGCGAGRSTRFLQRCGLAAVGVDISAEMIARAHEIDPQGDYRLIADGDLRQFADRTFALAFSAFTFDNIPTHARKVAIFRELNRVLKPEGRLVNLVSSPEIYTHEWASFSTKDYPENLHARTGDEVRIVNTAIEDRRPVVDIVWEDDAYRRVYAEAALAVIDVLKPIALPGEPHAWVNETTIAPWVIYVLGQRG